MKILTIKNIDTKDCIKLKVNDKRIHSYKDFIKDMKVGDHVTYSDSKNMWWRNGYVIKIEKSPILKLLQTKGKMPMLHRVGKRIKRGKYESIYDYRYLL